MHNQLVQFCEVLKIKLRNRLVHHRFHARRLLEELEKAGGSLFIPDAVNSVSWDEAGEVTAPRMAGGVSGGPAPVGGAAGSVLGAADGARQAMSLVFPQSAAGMLGLGLASVLTVGALYRRLVADLRPLVVLYLFAGAYNKAQLKLQAMELDRCLNVLLAFGEGAEDELESERVVRELSEAIAVRHIHHVSKLSKNGHKVLASVVVDRIFRHLRRHRATYEGESLIWYVADLQHAAWWLESSWDRLSKPADRVSSRPRLPLHARCVRAMTAEASESDERVLELEPLHSSGAASAQQGEDLAKGGGAGRWSAAGVLSRSGVFVHDQDALFVHSQTDVARFGFVYGSQDEVNWRRMRRPEELEEQSQAERAAVEAVEASHGKAPRLSSSKL